LHFKSSQLIHLFKLFVQRRLILFLYLSYSELLLSTSKFTSYASKCTACFAELCDIQETILAYRNSFHQKLRHLSQSFILFERVIAVWLNQFMDPIIECGDLIYHLIVGRILVLVCFRIHCNLFLLSLPLQCPVLLCSSMTYAKLRFYFIVILTASPALFRGSITLKSSGGTWSYRFTICYQWCSRTGLRWGFLAHLIIQTLGFLSLREIFWILIISNNILNVLIVSHQRPCLFSFESSLEILN